MLGRNWGPIGRAEVVVQRFSELMTRSATPSHQSDVILPESFEEVSSCKPSLASSCS